MMRCRMARCVLLSGLASLAGCRGTQPAPPVQPGGSASACADGQSVPAEIPRGRNEPVAGGDHGPPSAFIDAYTGLLHNHVQEDGPVDYRRLRRRRLDVTRALRTLGDLDPNTYAAWPNDRKAAFWINTYNLKMLEIIIRNYPIESSPWLRLTWPPSDIRHIAGIWTDYKVLVMNEEFALMEVERRFFHKSFGDPRVYLAITYASRSGPPLRRRPYRAEDLERQLDEQAKTFVVSPQGLRIDRQARIVRLSAIFKPAWRGREFVSRYGTEEKFHGRDPATRAVLNFITSYLPGDDVRFLESENYKIEYMSYDWRLDDTPGDS